MTSNPCPVCQQSVPGDSLEFERHVNKHLDEGEEEESRKVAEKLERGHIECEPNAAQPANVREQSDPAERMMREIEISDEAYARALAASGGYSTEHPVIVAPSLRGSLSDTAELFYPNVLVKVFPHFDGLEGIPRKKVHVSSKLDLFCSNVAGLGWDCGYRNIQMMFSALLYEADFARRLQAQGISEVPSVPEIAGRIEEAWRKGFDPEGAASFGGTLTDKEVWIGATEVYVLLRSLAIEAYVKDFEAPTDEDKRRMFDWVYDHFDQWCHGRHCLFHCKSLLNSKRQCLVPPIFCQWQGHSITIVGAEKTRGGEVILLVLDPSRGFYHSLMQQRISRHHLVRRAVDHPQFAQPRFQLVSVPSRKSPGVPGIRQTKRKVLERLRRGGPS